jgi:16S rRNA (guanine527-N7)-methyltransferase
LIICLPQALPGVSLQVRERLQKYIRLLHEWKSVTNLISKNGLEEVWLRHIADCLQFVSLAPNAKGWLDIGSGAGFPSVVIACQLAELPDTHIHAVESDGRRCVFLREVARTLRLPMHVHNRRAESLSPTELPPVNALTARAFATLSRTLEIAAPFLDAGAIGLFPRGKTAVNELGDINKHCYSCQSVPNTYDGSGCILVVQRPKLANPL